MSAPRADLSFVVFYDSHSADAIYTLGMPQGEQRVVCLLALAFSNFLGDVVSQDCSPVALAMAAKAMSATSAVSA